ncbi:putative glycolipid-binding domain-containing protein [Glycomyces salinus]|uniref:putative glycolipid-binding domain-containing protein n=1 Tax=Glycomyces salinus TaxID=980294 RepID=UPI0035564750
MWTALQWPGSEHLDQCVAADAIIADGLVIATSEGVPIRLAYRIECDPQWRNTQLETGYRYEPAGFRADLEASSDGLVTDYPDLWTIDLSHCEQCDRFAPDAPPIRAIAAGGSHGDDRPCAVHRRTTSVQPLRFDSTVVHRGLGRRRPRIAPRSSGRPGGPWPRPGYGLDRP